MIVNEKMRAELRTQVRECNERMREANRKGDGAGFEENFHLMHLVSDTQHLMHHQLRAENLRPIPTK